MVFVIFDTNDNAFYSFVTRMWNFNIGTDQPAYKLDVCGTIRSKEVIVETNWCDYVFEEDYQPMSILEKEHYYEQYKHLPNVPSAKEVEEYGVKIGHSLTGILQNVEENRLDITRLYKMILQLQEENRLLKEMLLNKKE